MLSSAGRQVLALGLGLLVGVYCCAAGAHDSRPLFVEVVQLDAGSFSLAWKAPSSVPVTNLPMVSLAEPCRVDAAPKTQVFRHSQRRLYRCRADQPPSVLLIDFPQANPSLSTILRLQLQSGQARVIYAPPEASQVEIAAMLRGSGVVWQYVQLGVQHIASGVDHLLFVACLVLLAVRWRRIVWAVTGFTLAHSITLALSTLDIVRLPIVPVEAVIALSIVFLAAELARPEGSAVTVARRFPGFVALLFGLLHGFGFASVLRDIGVPTGERFTALFAFNVGVELGQLAFVAVLLALLGLAHRFTTPQRLQQLAAYPVGIVASFWLYQRLFEVL